MTWEALGFLIFSVITLGSGALVVTTRNLFHAALYLMVSLFGVAGLFVLLTAPFLAGVEIMVYVGAIAILIIFAIMLTPQVMQVVRPRSNQWIAALVAAVLFFLVLVSVLTPVASELGVDNWSAGFTQDEPADVPADTLTTLGESLVDKDLYVLPFEVASVLLMAALIGAALMVRPDEPKPRRPEAGPVIEPGPEQATTGGD
ncbi:MAG TPA: NADH-quinone oxidoreductase subunit J [Aggregatilinea sp.]|jgi:NADH-quinone oxidoreductase subunit J|uniref:NADH-quinone oxidoreductase subunit J family protein n=1 Tax=Aggregatilinea sp. TaxID=2806333 RepID=UPI002B9BD8D4|nr:NADH-quinone oxidoreductase subunit J [Aggregatilinea sp.]HML24337.1 NADH-quinone oxidoreductase subunit J [Aggregatilinea sp.]